MTRILFMLALMLATAATVGAEYSDEPLAHILETYVDEQGLVDYAGLKENQAKLDAYLKNVALLDPKTYAAWSEDEQLAFLINAYNAYTLKAIVERYPLEEQPRGSWFYPRNSIRQIPGVWDELKWTVMGREMTLDDIEHGTIRKDFDEPRIHAALVCAAMSCPPLRDEPFRGDTLDDQLADQMRKWINSDKNVITADRNRIDVSKIFSWYGGDFKDSSGIVKDVSDKYAGFIAAMVPHVSKAEAEFLKRGGYRVGFMSYDWSLNDQSRK